MEDRIIALCVRKKFENGMISKPLPADQQGYTAEEIADIIKRPLAEVRSVLARICKQDKSGAEIGALKIINKDRYAPR